MFSFDRLMSWKLIKYRGGFSPKGRNSTLGNSFFEQIQEITRKISDICQFHLVRADFE